MKKEPMECIELENGLTLQLFDKSRLVTGDRYRVVFCARIEFDLKPEYIPDNELGLGWGDIRASVGERVVYQHENIRNFIDKSEKDKVFEDQKNHFLKTGLAYLSHPDFAGRLILRKYRQSKTFTPSGMSV